MWQAMGLTGSAYFLLFLLFILVLWILMPFAIFGTKTILAGILAEQKRTNELLARLVEPAQASPSRPAQAQAQWFDPRETP